MDLNWSEKFYIIINPEVDLVIHHQTYLTFQINLLNQLFKSINLYWIGGATSL